MKDGAEQNTIRRWCKKERPAFHYGREYSIEGVGQEGWEARLTAIGHFFSTFAELSEWEVAAGNKRLAHCVKVGKLARELATALEESVRPYYPPALCFFDEDRIVDIIKCLPDDITAGLLSNTKYGEGTGLIEAETGEKVYLSASSMLLRWMANHEDQELHKLLKSIATYADKNAAEQRRIGRPNTGHPNARAFALHLAENFDETFHCMPNEVIAACVCLKYPQLENPPNADTIRDWRGAK